MGLSAAAYRTGLEIERAEYDRMTRLDSDMTLPTKKLFVSPGSVTKVLFLLGQSHLVTLSLPGEDQRVGGILLFPVLVLISFVLQITSHGGSFSVN